MRPTRLFTKRRGPRGGRGGGSDRCLPPILQTHAFARSFTLPLETAVGSRSVADNAAYYNEFGQGDGLGWHFDRSRFGVNLVLQQPGAGGDFQIHHNTRTELDMYPFGTVGKILGGDLSEVVTVGGVGAGSLVLFSGRSSLHRVTPITASPPRINTILTFEEQPGQKANSCKSFPARPGSLCPHPAAIPPGVITPCHGGTPSWPDRPCAEVPIVFGWRCHRSRPSSNGLTSSATWKLGRPLLQMRCKSSLGDDNNNKQEKKISRPSF